MFNIIKKLFFNTTEAQRHREKNIKYFKFVDSFVLIIIIYLHKYCINILINKSIFNNFILNLL